MRNRIDIALKLSLAGLLAALCWVVVAGIRERVVQVGDSAADFSVTTDRGKTLTLAHFGGKVLVLNFWATWCAPCVEEIPSLNQFQREVAASGVVVLGISVDRNPKLYRQFRDRFHLTFSTARDPEANIAASYGTYKYPETYIIGRNDKVVRKEIGPINWTDPEVIDFVKSL